MQFLQARAKHIAQVARGWWAAIYCCWTFLCSIDVLIEHYASDSVKAIYNRAWLAPRWGWNISIIGFFAITVILVIEGSYRDALRIVRAYDEALAESEANRKEAETRLDNGHPILVLHVGKMAGSYEMAPSKYVLHLQNCGNRPARWVNVSSIQSTEKNYRLSFSRIAVIEPKATEYLHYAVHGMGGSAASIESFLADVPDGVYVTRYDLELKFRDTDESERTDTARLAYWPTDKVLGSVEVPYTKKDFKQP